MTPTVNQASDHILSLITTCDKHDASAIHTLAEAYRTLNLFLKPITLDLKGVCGKDCSTCEGPQPPTEQPEDDIALSTETPAEEAKPRRTRRSKEQIAADLAAEQTAQTTPEPEPIAEPEPTPELPAEPEPTHALPAEPEPEPEAEVTGDIPALRAEIGKVFAERKIEPGFKAELARFLKFHGSDTVVKLGDEHVPALLHTLKTWQP